MRRFERWPLITSYPTQTSKTEMRELRKIFTKRPPVLFIHIPKTGGSSASNSIRRKYRLSEFHIKAADSIRASTARLPHTGSHDMREVAIQDFRSALVLYAFYGRRNRFVTGHVWLQPELIDLTNAGVKIMTCFRDPVDRLLSHYLYNRYHLEDHTHTKMEIEEFMETERAKELAQMYTKYLCGRRISETMHESEAIGIAVTSRMILFPRGAILCGVHANC